MKTTALHRLLLAAASLVLLAAAARSQVTIVAPSSIRVVITDGPVQEQTAPGTTNAATPAPVAPGDVWGVCEPRKRTDANGIAGFSTTGNAAGVAMGNGSWLSGGGAASASETYIVTASTASPGKIYCQGYAHVAGHGRVELSNAVGNCWSAAMGRSKVAYGIVVKAENIDIKNIAAGQPGVFQQNITIFGQTIPVVVVTGGQHAYTIHDTDVGAWAESRCATILYVRKVEYGFNINSGTAGAEAEVKTCAMVVFQLVVD